MKNDVLVCFIVFQAVFFFLDIYVYTKTNRDIARKGEYTSFCALIAVHMAYLVLNSLWSLQEYGVIHLSKGYMTALCAGSLWSVMGCSFAFFSFTVEKIQFVPMKARALRLLAVLPALLSTVLIIASPWTGWVFILSEMNLILHGPLYPAMVVSSSLYLLAVALIAVYNMVTARTAFRRQSSGALLFSVMLIILFVIIDDLLTQASILPVAVFAVILVIFISMQEANINSDALTGMNNRRKADEFLTDRLLEVSKENPLYLYMGDLNDFKQINDAYGHMEGDDALMLCSDVLKHVIARYNGFAARYGGDEFLMSWRPGRGEEPDPEALIDDVNRQLDERARILGKPYGLTMSLGYARCTDRAEPLSACIRRADDMLYSRKAAFHRSRGGRIAG